MAKFIVGGYARQGEDISTKEEKKDWRLIKTIKLTSSNDKIVIDTDTEGNPFDCEEVIIHSKIISNTQSKPMCKVNGEVIFSGISSVYINGTRYCYDNFISKGDFIERDMKYSSQDILETSVLFDNGFFRVIRQVHENINSIEYYGDSASFLFKAGTEISIYGK